MDCSVTRDWLLHAERPGDAPGVVAGHLRSCDGCAALAGRLERLESSLRDASLPGNVSAGANAFLRRLAATPAPVRRPVDESRRWVVATLMLLAFGFGSLIVLSGTPAQASVLDQLVDFNVQLADGDARPDALRRFALAEPGLTANSRHLPDGERDLAESLLHANRALVATDDPVESVAAMHDVADRLFEGMRKSPARAEARKFGRLYERVTKHALDPMLDRASALATMTPEQARKFDKARKGVERRKAAGDETSEMRKKPFRKADGKKKSKAKSPE